MVEGTDVCVDVRGNNSAGGDFSEARAHAWSGKQAPLDLNHHGSSTLELNQSGKGLPNVEFTDYAQTAKRGQGSTTEFTDYAQTAKRGQGSTTEFTDYAQTAKRGQGSVTEFTDHAQTKRGQGSVTEFTDYAQTAKRGSAKDASKPELNVQGDIMIVDMQSNKAFAQMPDATISEKNYAARQNRALPVNKA